MRVLGREKHFLEPYLAVRMKGCFVGFPERCPADLVEQIFSD